MSRPPRSSLPASRLSRFRSADILSVHDGEAYGISPYSGAAVEGRTLFRHTVVEPDLTRNRILVSGWNNAKVGKWVEKGRWAGMPIWCLTLEERATCPQSCHHWLTCYGNGMNWARRNRPGEALERGLEIELAGLQRKHPRGFVVRLHILGDFYSIGYVEAWGRFLDTFPALRVFGFTARLPGTPIGNAVQDLARRRWDRFAIRVSQPAGEGPWNPEARYATTAAALGPAAAPRPRRHRLPAAARHHRGLRDLRALLVHRPGHRLRPARPGSRPPRPPPTRTPWNPRP